MGIYFKERDQNNQKRCTQEISSNSNATRKPFLINSFDFDFDSVENRKWIGIDLEANTMIQRKKDT